MSNSKSEDSLYEILDAFALEYLEAHMEPDYGIGQRLQVESELVQDVKEQVIAWHKSEVAKLLQVIEDEVEQAYKSHQMNKDFTTESQNFFLNGTQAMVISTRQAIKKIKDNVINGGSL